MARSRQADDRAEEENIGDERMDEPQEEEQVPVPIVEAPIVNGRISYAALLKDVCGLNDNEVEWFTGSGFTSLSEMVHFKETEIGDTIAQIRKEKYAPDSNKPTRLSYKPFRPVQERHLKSLWSEVQIRRETGRDVEDIRKVGVNASDLVKWRARRLQRDGLEDPPSDQRPSAAFLSKNWIKGFEHLDLWIGSHVDGSYKIPLSFMIRLDPNPIYVERVYESLDSEYAHSCPRLAPDGSEADWYQPANKKLWEIMFSIFYDHTSYGIIKGFAKAKDGYGAYHAMKNHLLGAHALGTMSRDIESQFASLSYTGEGRRWNFEKYVTKHLELYAQAQDLRRFGLVGMDDHTRVRKLMDGIKTNKLESVKTMILANPALQTDFEGAVALYKQYISQDKTMTAGRPTSEIAAVNGRSKGSRSGGDNGGKRRQAKRANGQVSQVTVADRYYTSAEYSKLSKEERDALFKLRQGRKRQRGNDGSARQAVLEAQVEELPAAVKAMSTSGDDDDDSTVTVSNGGTSNRSNPALVRQGRPKKNG
jgi:hypothetical protein